MKTVAVIVARMGSRRLPGKVMMPIMGKPMIERLIERIGHSRYVKETVIATTKLSNDDMLASLAKRMGTRCFRGSVDDVLGRVQDAVGLTEADLVVEVLGDNPLVHSDLIDDVIAFHCTQGFDYSANVTTEYPHAGADLAKFPIGVRVQVYTAAVLNKCGQLATDSYEREHSTSFIYHHPEIFKLGYFEAKATWAGLNRPDLTFAVNYQQNLELVSSIFHECYRADPNFSLHLALKAFDSSPSMYKLMGPPGQQQNSD